MRCHWSSYRCLARGIRPLGLRAVDRLLIIVALGSPLVVIPPAIRARENPGWTRPNADDRILRRGFSSANIASAPRSGSQIRHGASNSVDIAGRSHERPADVPAGERATLNVIPSVLGANR